jgi:hypothetical protein
MKLNKTPFDPTRRNFFRQACCAAVGATGMLSALSQLRLIGAMAADVRPHRLQGAGLPVPSGRQRYEQRHHPLRHRRLQRLYAAARTILAVPQSQVLPISPTDVFGRPDLGASSVAARGPEPCLPRATSRSWRTWARSSSRRPSPQYNAGTGSAAAAVLAHRPADPVAEQRARTSPFHDRLGRPPGRPGERDERRTTRSRCRSASPATIPSRSATTVSAVRREPDRRHRPQRQHELRTSNPSGRHPLPGADGPPERSRRRTCSRRPSPG